MTGNDERLGLKGRVLAAWWGVLERVGKPFGYTRRAVCPYCGNRFAAFGPGNVLQHIVRYHIEYEGRLHG